MIVCTNSINLLNVQGLAGRAPPGPGASSHTIKEDGGLPLLVFAGGTSSAKIKWGVRTKELDTIRSANEKRDDNILLFILFIG